MERWDDLMKVAEARHAVVTYDELLQAGCTPTGVGRLCDEGRIVRVARGVYRVAGAPRTFALRVAAAVRSFGGMAWASHHTAARLWGLGIDRADPRLEVLRPYGLSGARGGVTVHRTRHLPDHHVAVVEGVPVTSPARTLFDLARTAGERRLGRAVSEAVHADQVPCSVAALYRVLHDLSTPGRPGSRRLRRVLDAWDTGEPATESELDVVGRALLRDVPGIRFQVPLSDARGYIRRVDALVDEARLVIELDGARFHDVPAQRALDEDGDARLVALGLDVLRLRWPHITREATSTLAEVQRLVARAVAA